MFSQQFGVSGLLNTRNIQLFRIPESHECFLRYALKLRKCFADYETSRQRGGEQMIEFWRVFLALTPRMMSSNVCFFLSKKHFKALKYSLYDHIKQRMNENE